jgi:tRNA threonylcarbamoyl adenosine modification protein YjeE
MAERGGEAHQPKLWRFEAPDEAAMLGFAAAQAAWLEPGDFVGLTGDLGAGKTTFARGLLRALAEAADLEAPSPTFTLMQVYETPRGPVVHADFYRLRSALELDNIGWDEALVGAIAIVEWPERVAAALPADRLDVTIRFDPARGPDFRLLELRGRGTVGRRLSRALGVGALLKRTGWDEARREFLQGDASVRAYERFTSADGGAAILMISPPRADGPILRYGKPYAAIAKLSPDIRAFIAMAEGLRAYGFSAPKLFGYSIEEGLALIEDFGAETVVEDGIPNVARYAEAIALLVDLHGRDLPDALPAGEDLYRLPTYDIEAMLVEVELALDWYAPAIARVAVPSGARMQFLAHWRELLSPILAQRTTWTLRDYHSPNLHWLAEREGFARIGLIDFQDAVIGPPAYDLASLLQDARIDVSDDLEMRLAALYVRRRRAADPDFDAGRFAVAYAAMGTQRATKILGLFARLDKRDGKPQYLFHLPRIERYLAKNLAHPLLRPLAVWYQTYLPRALGPPPEEPLVPRDPRSDRR